MDREVGREIDKLSLRVEIDEHSRYAVLVRVTDPQQQVNLVHIFSWSVFVRLGLKRPIGEGEVLHHRNHDKLDNSYENLERLTPAQHAAVHAAGKQRFSRRRRFRLAGFYLPRAPGPLTRPPAGSLLLEPPPTRTDLAKGQTDRPPRNMAEFKAHLADVLPALRETMNAHGLSRWAPSPVATAQQWRDSKTLRLGLKRPNLRLSRAEASLLGFLILAGLDREIVATELAVPKDWLEKMIAKPSVSHALERWQRSQGVPYLLLPPRKPRKN